MRQIPQAIPTCQHQETCCRVCANNCSLDLVASATFLRSTLRPITEPLLLVMFPALHLGISEPQNFRTSESQNFLLDLCPHPPPEHLLKHSKSPDHDFALQLLSAPPSEPSTALASSYSTPNMDYLAEPPSPARSKRAGSTVNPLCVTKAKKLKVSKPKNSSKSFKCVIRAAYEAKKSSLELLDHRKQRCSRGLRFENLSAHKKHVDALLHSPIRFRKCQHCPYYFLEPRLDDHQRECKGKPASKGAKAQLEIWQHMYGQLVPDEPFPYACEYFRELLRAVS